MSSAERSIGRHTVELVLLTRDAPYARDMAAFLSESGSHVKLTATVKDPSAVKGVVAQHPGCVVLLDADLELPDLPSFTAGLITGGAAKILLLVSSLRGRPVPPDVEPLFKYMLGSSLLERIRSLSLSAPTARSAQAAAIAQAELATSARPAVIALYSPRGGAGTSTLTANLAYLYAAKGKRVAVVDLARFGSQHVMVRQPQRGQGLSGLVTLLSQEPGAAGSERMATYLEQALIRVEQGKVGFHLLPAALPNRMDQVTGEQVQAIIAQLLRGGFHLVLLDLSSELSDRVRGAMAAATRVVVPVLPEIVSAWHALQTRDVLANLLGGRTKLGFVINRQRPDSGFDPDEFLRLGGSPFLGTLPDDYRNVRTDLAQGRLTAARTGAPVTRALRRIAHTLYPVFTDAEVKQGRWPWSKG